MRYGIFGDIHSNLAAYTKILDAYKEYAIDNYICVGDIVGYAAEPSECIALTRENNVKVVAGNHDWAVAGRLTLGWFKETAQEALIWTRKALNKEEIDYLSSLELIYEADSFSVVHSSLNEPEGFHYLTQINEVNTVFSLLTKNILFIGHTHRPGVFIMSEDDIEYRETERLSVYDYKKYIVNVGSVGQPRDKDNRACFCIYDSEENSIETKRIAYDISTTQRKIINAGLPMRFATRLSTGS